nr:hypothetical protein FICFSXYB_FICFSXYB_CDS_0007 [Microvirus sp.]
MKIEDLQSVQKITPLHYEIKNGFHHLFEDLVHTNIQESVYNLKDLCYFEPSVCIVQVTKYIKRDGDLRFTLSPYFFRYWPNQTTLRKLGLRPDYVVVIDSDNTYRHD